MKQLFTSPKFISISIAIIALIILPLTLIEIQNQQILQQHADTLNTNMLFGSTASSACPGSGYNGDKNAVVWCGADDNGTPKASKITDAYNKGDGHNSAKSIQNIYGSSTYNITSSDIQNLSKESQVGSVTKSGDVIVGGKVVATNASSAGRQDIPGSVKHSNNGTVYYTSPPRISFLNNSLKAYVVMKNGKFKFAILQACGNPVSGTPKVAPTPIPTSKPTPKPTLPPGQPTPTICPTLGPVKNVHIVCPNCQLTPSPNASPNP